MSYIDKMIAPSQRRETAYKGGIIQIWITRACDRACAGCTQASQLAGKPGMITVEQFEAAVISLKDYFGVVGLFGGNATIHPQFETICEILRKHRDRSLCGLWSNALLGKGAAARATFDPRVSNLNVHLSKEAYDEFRRDWPESMPFGLETDSRHATPFVAMSDMEDVTQEMREEMISHCDVNQFWSAMICVVRNELVGMFCEVAGSQAMLQQWEKKPDGSWLIPDTGIPIIGCGGVVNTDWWKQSIRAYEQQISFHCNRCGIPMRGEGELAAAAEGSVELYSKTYESVVRPKIKDKLVQLVTKMSDLKPKGQPVTTYLGK